MSTKILKWVWITAVTQLVMGAVFTQLACSQETKGNLDRAKSAKSELESTMILLPAYFYPAGPELQHWERLLKSPNANRILAIFNPASGPGEQVDANYTSILDRAASVGLHRLGYVTTSYAKRPIQEVQAEVDKWIQLYPRIEGIFFDEQASGAEAVEYQRQLYQYVRVQKKLRYVVTNPGTECNENFFKTTTADSCCLYEGFEVTSALKMPEWTKRYKPERMTVLAYRVKSSEQMRAAAKLILQQGSGLFFITDGDLPNPWNRLPDYWEDELKLLDEPARKSP